jgi:hypothetical protein
MPDPKQKLVKVKEKVIAFPSTMEDDHIAAAIKTHRESIPYPETTEGPEVIIPPELTRVQREIGVEYSPARPHNNAIATVGEHEPHVIEINDPKRFAQGPKQTSSHEITHLLLNNLAGKVNKAIPPDNPKDPYNISNVDEKRKKGLKLWQLPQEQAATIIQTWVADPSQRQRLQPWINDLNSAPLTIMMPTRPEDTILNRTVRPIEPPLEAWEPRPRQKLTPQQLRAQAEALQRKFKPSGITR